MTHLSEEELIAQLYGDGDNAGHLDGCTECSRAYAALKSDLAEMKFPDPPECDAAYGREVWASLSASLHAYESPRPSLWSGKAWRRLSYAAVCALLVACAFLGGRLWERKQTQPAAGISASQKPQPVVQAPLREHVVVVVLSDHLDRSERLLVELKHAGSDSNGLESPLRDEARTLLVANRICRQNARHDDDPALAPALERLNHLLEELANQSGDLNQATLTRLQNETNTNSLLFEVRVLRSRLPERRAAVTGHTKGGTI